METIALPEPALNYPESNGQPMADNTTQFRWIVLIKTNLDLLFRDDPHVFVAGDLLWYAVKGQPDKCRAPDVMVVFGRPKRDRGSYLQWEEDDIAPQVVFEIISPGNTLKDYDEKLRFYRRYGVEEYYLYYPQEGVFQVWIRDAQHFRLIEDSQGWVSPRLGIHFEMDNALELRIYRPDGSVFEAFEDIDEERRRLKARQEKLEAKLRELGIDPESIEL